MTISTLLQNSAPQYIQFPALLSNSLNDSELANDLVQHLDQCIENGTAMQLLDMAMADNEELKTHRPKGSQINVNDDPIFSSRIVDHMFKLIQILNTFLPVNSPIEQIHSWGDSILIRKYVPNEIDIDFPPRIHVDYNENFKKDIASISVALNHPKEYRGGEIIISDGFDQYTGKHQFKTLPKLHMGDGIAWDGWTLHGVNPVTAGERYVMVIHFQGRLL